MGLFQCQCEPVADIRVVRPQGQRLFKGPDGLLQSTGGTQRRGEVHAGSHVSRIAHQDVTVGGHGRIMAALRLLANAKVELRLDGIRIQDDCAPKARYCSREVFLCPLRDAEIVVQRRIARLQAHCLAQTEFRFGRAAHGEQGTPQTGTR